MNRQRTASIAVPHCNSRIGKAEIDDGLLSTGTMAAVNFYKDLSAKNNGLPKIVELDGRPGVKEVSAELMAKLDQ